MNHISNPHLKLCLAPVVSHLDYSGLVGVVSHYILPPAIYVVEWKKKEKKQNKMQNSAAGASPEILSLFMETGHIGAWAIWK